MQKPATVLVVDDNDKNLQLVGSILIKEGYEVAVASSGKKALITIEKINPDLVLLDIMMPDMDGYEVCKTIKKNKAVSQTPVIFLTAKTEIGDIVSGFDTGAVDYILKPYDAKELIARVKTHLELKQAKENAIRDAKEINKLNTVLAQKNLDLKHINKAMDQIIKDRTAQLESANTRLSAMNQEKMDFIRFLSHELNTPLNFISAASTIDRDHLNPDSMEILDMVEQGFERISNFVEEVINYFQFTAELRHIKKENFALDPVLEKLIARLEPFARDKGLEILQGGMKNLCVTEDSGCLERVLRILIVNAIEFSNQNGKIRIEAEMKNKVVCVHISDTGRGIPAKNLGLIFKPFMIPEFERNETGYALNLPRAKNIADECGWHLSAQSEGPGKGACFTLELNPQ